ncbi:MAG: sugar ABC transporter substrate-binding protein [Abditibacteriota bacterium]|nr:sugar ABC transporter substrate-binding protein [Abditibacteriota bacterium]
MKRIILILAALLVLLCGCGKKEKDVNLLVLSWINEQDEARMREHIKEFEKIHPNIHVDLEILPWARMMDKLMISTAGGRPPDATMVCSAWAVPLENKGVLEPLDEYIKETGFDIDDFYGNALEVCRYKGKLYSIPVAIDSYAMYYNKKMFDEAGVPYPDETWDFDKYVEMCKKFTVDTDGDGRADRWGTDVHTDAITYLYGFGGRYLSEDNTKCVLNSPEAVHTFEFLTDFVHKYKISPGNADTANVNNSKLFTQGKIATVVSGSWAADAVFSKEGKAIGLDFDVAPVPKGPKGRYTKIIINSYGVMRRSEHKKEAWLLVQWITNGDWQKTAIESSQVIPSRKSVTKEFLTVDRPPRNKQAFIDAIDYGVGSLKVPCGPEIESVMNSAIDKMFLGREPVKQIADDLVPTVNKMLTGEGK